MGYLGEGKSLGGIEDIKKNMDAWTGRVVRDLKVQPVRTPLC
jgi:hypothetical protein